MASPRIGLIADSVKPGIAEGAAAYARAHGLEIDPRPLREAWTNPREWQGLIAEVAHEERLRDLTLPMVLLSPAGSVREGISRVEPDFRACGALALEELANLGVRSLITWRSTTGPVDAEACAGFIEAANQKGRRVIDPEPLRRAIQANTSPPDFVKLCVETLMEVERPAGIFLADAGFAYSLLGELRRRGFRVPEDISLVVIDDASGTAAMASVPLTTVDPDVWQQGYFAADLLHRQLLGETAGSFHRIPPVGITHRDSTGVAVTRDPAVSKVLYIIRERFANDLKVEELAKLAGVGRRSLEERFRKEMRVSIHDAVVRRRTEEAKRLLKSTPMSISLVAEACGYSTVHYFSTAFKRETGITPAAYRTASRAKPKGVGG